MRLLHSAKRFCACHAGQPVVVTQARVYLDWHRCTHKCTWRLPSRCLCFFFAAGVTVREGSWVPREAALPMRLHLPARGGDTDVEPGADAYLTGSALMEWQPELRNDRRSQPLRPRPLQPDWQADMSHVAGIPARPCQHLQMQPLLS